MADPGADLATPVLPGLYVGPLLYAKSRAWLRRHGITHVVNCTPMAPCFYSADLSYLRVPVRDEAAAPMAASFGACHAFARDAWRRGGGVLIHCHMGRSRATTLAAAIAMAEASLSWREALEAVRSARPSARPNPGFVRQLRDHELALAESTRDESRQPAAMRAGAVTATVVATTLRAEKGRENAVVQLYLAAAPLGGMAEATTVDALATLLGSDGDPPSELAFVPGPLHAEMNAEKSAEKSAEIDANAPRGELWLRVDGHVAIGATQLPRLWDDAVSAWGGVRRGGCVTAVRAGGAVVASCFTRLERLSRVVVLLSGGQSYSAWNDRKRLLLRRTHPSGASFVHVAKAELRLSALAIASFPKAREPWARLPRGRSPRLPRGRCTPLPRERCSILPRGRSPRLPRGRCTPLPRGRCPRLPRRRTRRGPIGDGCSSSSISAARLAISAARLAISAARSS